MARGDPKFASEQGEQWLPHEFGNLYAHEMASSPLRTMGRAFCTI